jgi:hypothetical protein
VTEKLKATGTHQNFKRWCDENGIKTPGADYPVAYGPRGQLVGMAAKKDIEPMQAFLYVPMDVVINEYNARRRCPEIGFIFDRHPEMFKKHRDAEYNTLIMYVMHELLKGKDSFWHPYFEIICRPDLPMLWDAS